MRRKFYVGTLVVFLLAACGNEGNSNETDTYKVSEGKITNEKLLTNLAVRAEAIIEKYDELDDVEVDVAQITADKHPDLINEETENIYTNVYYIHGEYSYQGRNYDFVWCVSFDENNADSTGQDLQYTSDSETGKKINVNRSPTK
ncbi:hypothetical protein [Psychrobacillus antarcticus]|uniref:hypothetical protein n=1 Tax=Psychrobacillus antarcticus TaxID=2879115 RepID=UPI002407BA6C|nr:hypothetical protein [Psychrobacillus antarcticus]